MQGKHYFFFILFFSTIFNHTSSIADGNRSKSELEKKISEAEFAEEVFHVDTTILSLPIKFDGGEIISIMVTHNNSIVVSYFRTPAVQLFDKQGKFLKQIGGKGQGPGEFQMPWFITECQNQIIVGEHGANRFNIFNINGEFRRAFRLDHWIIVDGLCTADSLIVINDVTGARYKKENNIYLYNLRGKMIKKFGELSNVGKKLWKLNYYTWSPHVAYYNGFIFHANYCDYYIWKYNLKGELIKKFGCKPDNWKSLLKAKIARDFNASKVMSDLKGFFKEIRKYSMINWLVACPPGFVIEEILQESTFTKNIHRIAIYNVDGELINSGLKIKTFQNYNNPYNLSLLPLKGRGFVVLIRSYNDKETYTDDGNYIVNIKMLKFTLPK